MILELQNLYKLKRTRFDCWTIFNYLNGKLGLQLCQIPYAAVVQEALDIEWTSDPFDRLIVAHAQANKNAPLVTSDDRILTNYAKSVW